MGVVFSNRCELALQTTLFLSSLPEGGSASVKEISGKLGVSRDFTSKVLQELVGDGIVKSRKGKFGGFCLRKDKNEISLIDIVAAVEGTEMFEKCVLGFPGCSEREPCPVHNEWGPVRNKIRAMLSEQSLADLAGRTEKKLTDIATLLNEQSDRPE